MNQMKDLWLSTVCSRTVARGAIPDLG